MVFGVGFDPYYILAHAILYARETIVEETITPKKRKQSSSVIPVSVRRRVMLGIDAVGPQLVQSQLLEIGFLSIGAFTGIPYLSEFCVIAALILLFGLFYLFTLFLAVLTLKMELQRIRESDPDEKSNDSNSIELEEPVKLSTNSNKSLVKLILVFVLLTLGFYHLLVLFCIWWFNDFACFAVVSFWIASTKLCKS